MCKDDCKCTTKCSDCSCETEDVNESTEVIEQVTEEDKPLSQREMFEKIKEMHAQLPPKEKIELTEEQKSELDEFKIMVKTEVEDHIKQKLKYSNVEVLYSDKNEISMNIHGVTCQPRIRLKMAAPSRIKDIKKMCLDSAKKNDHTIRLSILLCE